MSKQNRGLRARRARGGDPVSEIQVHCSRHAHLLLEELCSCLREASDPALEGIRILRLSMSTDGGHAQLAYVVAAPELRDEIPVRREAQAALARAAPFLRAQLAERLSLRSVPTLGFAFAGLVQLTKGDDEPCQQ